MRTFPPERARVVIAAAPTLFRAGLRRVIEGEWPFYTVVEAETLSETATHVTTLRPDLLVLDLALSEFPQSLALRTFVSSVPVVVLVDNDHVELDSVRRLGITLVDKQSDATTFLNVIRFTLTGANATASDAHLRSLPPRSAATSHRSFNLTRRERQVVAEVAAAYPNKEIARRLNISEETVKRHVNTVFTKLGVSNRVELTLFATYWGLVPESPRARLAALPDESSLAV